MKYIHLIGLALLSTLCSQKSSTCIFSVILSELCSVETTFVSLLKIWELKTKTFVTDIKTKFVKKYPCYEILWFRIALYVKDGKNKTKIYLNNKFSPFFVSDFKNSDSIYIDIYRFTSHTRWTFPVRLDTKRKSAMAK